MKSTAYLLQAALVSLWWLGLESSPAFFSAFQFDGIPPTAFWAFFAPDVLLIAVLSVGRAYFRNALIQHLILGAFGYATLYCCNATILTNSGYLSSGLMLLGLFYNIFLCFHEYLFRSSSSSLAWNAAKTFVQSLCIWILSLAVIPAVLLDAFGALAIPEFGPKLIVGSLSFLSFSALGITSAVFMVRDGDGTPPQMDQTNKLVVSGPYRFVRNPMAIAGIGQGISIAIAFWSLPVLVYSLLGVAVWHFAVRPCEERDMLTRFGEPYRQYRQDVMCWCPTLRKRAP